MNIERFFSNVIPEPNSGCWLWLGSTFKETGRTKGYGRFGKHSKLAHRISWEIVNGPLTGGMVCHRCDNILCVNPDHLYLGTPQSNMADKVSRSRQARGASIRPTKMTAEAARFIKGHRNIPNRELADKFGVSTSAVWNIKNGLSWGWA